MPIIKCDKLTHVYPAPHEGAQDVVALDGVDLNIFRGQFVAVLGGNGSGKSTLAKHFNGLLLPTSGKCTVAGYDTADIDRIWDIRSACGMVFQNPDNQIVAAIVEEDIAFGPENLGIDPSEIVFRVDNALKTVGMEEYRKHSPHLLSGGQKQRVAIAGALAMDAQILVLDEPTAMLDPASRKEVLNVLLSLKKGNEKTLVLITHFMEEAALADRVIVMNNGKIVVDGSPEEVFSQTELLTECGLEAPLAVEIASGFRAAGISVPEKVIHDAALLEYICH